MADNKEKKCTHAACICTVTDGKKYCSQYCEDAGTDDVEISCDCGHPGCSLAEV